MKTYLNTLFALLVMLTSITLTGCGSNNKLVDFDSVSRPYIETAVISDYVARHGGRVPGQVRQDLFSFNLNNRLSLFLWQNWQDGDFNERDFGFNYSLPINDKLTLNAGYQLWTYPNGIFGKHDEVIELNATYNDKVTVKFDITHLLPNSQGDGVETESGTRYYVKVSKDFSLGKIAGAEISLTPSLSTAYVDNYYGLRGNSQITLGADLGISKGNLSAHFFINKQGGQISGIESFTYSGASIGWNF